LGHWHNIRPFTGCQVKCISSIIIFDKKLISLLVATPFPPTLLTH
jgi:hypothetical protein